MMFLPGWLTAHESTVEPGTLIVCDSARRPGTADHAYRVRIMRANGTTATHWRTKENGARQLFERIAESHELGEKTL
jgi:predicted O-methyltransferase YrrM